MAHAAERLGHLLRSLAVLGAGNYGAMAASLLINALLTRRLGTEQFGHLTLLLTASQVTLTLVANWTQTGLVQFGAREFSSSGSVAQTFWARFFVVAPWAGLAVAAAIVARQQIAAYLSIPAWGIAVILSHVLAAFALLMVGAAFQARNEMSRYGIALFLDKATMAALLLLPGLTIRDPLLLLALYAISSSLVAAWGFMALGGSLWPVVLHRETYRGLLAFSLPLVVSSWVGLLGTNWIDFAVIKRFRPVSDLGLYSLGVVLAGVVQQVTIIFSTLVLPQLSVMVAKGELDRIRTLIERLLPYWLLATSVLFSVVLMISGWIVPLIFGRAFERSAVILALLMPAASALAIFSAFSPLVTAFGSTWTLTAIYLVAGGVNIAADLILVPAYGITGSAWATVLSYATSACIVLTYAGSRLHDRLWGLLLLSLPVAVVCAWFVVIDGPWFYVLAAASAAVTVFWLARHFRLFRSEDRVFFESLRIAAPFLPAVSFAARRR